MNGGRASRAKHGPAHDPQPTPLVTSPHEYTVQPVHHMTDEAIAVAVSQLHVRVQERLPSLVHGFGLPSRFTISSAVSSHKSL